MPEASYTQPPSRPRQAGSGCKLPRASAQLSSSCLCWRPRPEHTAFLRTRPCVRRSRAVAAVLTLYAAAAASPRLGPNRSPVAVPISSPTPPEGIREAAGPNKQSTPTSHVTPCLTSLSNVVIYYLVLILLQRTNAAVGRCVGEV